MRVVPPAIDAWERVPKSLVVASVKLLLRCSRKVRLRKEALSPRPSRLLSASRKPLNWKLFSTSKSMLAVVLHSSHV